MVTLLAWILLIINLTIFVISLIVLFMHPKSRSKLPAGNTHVINLPYIPSAWEESIDTKNEKSRIIQHIKLRYPEFMILFEDISTEHACIFRFKGLSRKEESILYVLRNEDAKESFFAAVEGFIENAKTPMYGIVFALPFTHTCNDEMLQQLNAFHISLHMIMHDESNMNNLFFSEGKEAYVGIGRKPYAIFEVDHDNEEFDWLGELNSYQLFQPVYTKQADLAVHSIQKILTSSMRLYLRFSFLFSKKLMKELMVQYPETVSWFLPLIDKQEKHLILYAPSGESLEEAVSILIASAKKSNVTLKLIEKDRKDHIFFSDDQEYQTLMDIIDAACFPDAVIPVLIENYHPYHCQCPVVSFAPLFQNKKTSSSLAIRYYQQLLTFKNQS